MTHYTHPSTTLIFRGLLLTPPSTSRLLATIQCPSSRTCTPLHQPFRCTKLSAQSTYSFGMHATVLCNDNASTSPQSRRISYTAPHPHCPNTLEFYQCLQLHQLPTRYPPFEQEVCISNDTMHTTSFSPPSPSEFHITCMPTFPPSTYYHFWSPAPTWHGPRGHSILPSSRTFQSTRSSLHTRLHAAASFRTPLHFFRLLAAILELTLRFL